VSSLTIGLTGGLASGKSTVARWLRQAGHAVVDADQLVSELYRPDQPGAQAVRRLCGTAGLTADGGVDHQRLAELIFEDATLRRQLEAEIHPLVGDRLRRIVAATDGVLVFEATLLTEAGFAADFDLLVTVEAGVEARIARAVERGMTGDDARARLAAQGGADRRRDAADLVIDNNGDLEALRRQVDALIGEINRRLTARQNDA